MEKDALLKKAPWSSSGPCYEPREEYSKDTRASQRGKVVLIAFLCAALWISIYGTAPNSGANNKSPLKDVPQWMQQSWTMLSPWEAKGVYVPPPDGCVITQVNLLQRHGARHPSGDDGNKYKESLNKLMDVKDAIPPRSPLAFLRKYEYVLKNEDLLPFGAVQSAQRGEYDFRRYQQLFEKEMPFVRASGSQRVVDSATNWTQGISDASGGIAKPNVALVISEEHGNNTLDDNACTNADNGKDQPHLWLRQFGPRIANRLNKWAPGANVEESDIFHLMSICPIETQLRQEPSPFCGLFTKDEWASYEYYGDLEKFYRTGYGQPLGPVQGVGYVNELIARLTNSPVQDRTQVNHTLDSNPATFPLGWFFYADFTHENLMVAAFAAMGLFKSGSPPDPLKPDPARTWLSSKLVPFSARFVVERLQCTAGVPFKDAPSNQYLRMFLNEASVALECARGRKDNMCEVGAWVAGQTYARSNGAGDWEKCFD